MENFHLNHYFTILFFVVLTGCSNESDSVSTTPTGEKIAHPTLKENEEGNVIAAEYSQGNVTTDSIKALQDHGDTLQEVSFFEISEFSPDVFDEFKSFKNVQTLNFVRCEIGDDELEMLKVFPNVTKLSLTHTKITRQGIASLASWSNLEKLKLGDGFSSSSLSPIPKLSQLHFLELSSSDAKLSELNGLENLSNLKTLELTNAETTDEDLAALPELLNLEEFVFVPFSVTNDGIESITKLNRIKSLNLAGSKISDPGLKFLSTLSTLEQLILTGCQSVSSDGIAHMVNLPNLQSLRLDNCKQVTNEALDEVAKFPKLKVLNLVGSGTTGDGLEQLVKCRTLVDLKITAETSTQEQAMAFQNKRPECQLTRVRTTPP